MKQLDYVLEVKLLFNEIVFIMQSLYHHITNLWRTHWLMPPSETESKT